jgi:ribose-phosphate pyrophosphokinase
VKIFSGSSNKPLAEKVAKKLNLELSPLEIHIFPDGEKRIRVEEKVVDEDCVVIQSAGTPADSNYMELFFIVDALKRSGAKSITAVIPYLGYQRQDHIFRDGEAVSLRVVIEALEKIGATKIITFDLHSIKIPEFFRIPIVHLSALGLFANEIKKLDNHGVLVTPDMGGIRRIKIISEDLKMPFATIVKDRDLETGKIQSQELQGELKDTAFLVDDMISTGETLVKAAELLLGKGVKKVYALATHPVFSGNISNLYNSPIEKIFVTDSIDIPEEKKDDKLEILSIAVEICGSLKQ